jgi:hypothetical protein
MNTRDILFKTSRFNLSQVGQEDWGWYLQATYGGDSYLLGMNGNRELNPTNTDDGEWRMIVKKNLSIWQRLKGMGKIATDDAMLILVEQILRSESDFKNVHREDGR